MKAPCSGAICIRDRPPVRSAVSATSRSCTLVGLDVLCSDGVASHGGVDARSPHLGRPRRSTLTACDTGRPWPSRACSRPSAGCSFFVALVDRFYEHVAHDIMLRAVVKNPDDLAPTCERLWLFLAQYWGGPTTYSDGRGHPRLRMRHAPFAIGRHEREHWLRHMRAAIDATAADDQEAADALHAYVTMAAEAMQNRPS